MDPIQILNETDSEQKRATNEKKLKTEKKLIKALEMIQASFETFSETKKRKKRDIDTPLKRRFSSSQDYMIYFYKKSERERERKRENSSCDKKNWNKARAWYTSTAIVANTSNPVGTVSPDATAEQCYATNSKKKE